jgi:hypothetical protein
MDKDRDLLPWIFGGLSLDAVAMAVILGSAYGNASKHLQQPSLITAHPLPEAPTQTVPTQTVPTQTIPAPTPAPAPILAAAEIQTAAPPAQPNSQVWECTINGQKTFSDNPCGEKSSLHDIGPINGMEPTPILPHARSFAPQSSYQPEYSYPDEPADSYAGEQPFVSNAYPVFVGIPYREHRRPDRDREHRRPDRGHRLYNHDRGSIGRKY